MTIFRARSTLQERCRGLRAQALAIPGTVISGTLHAAIQVAPPQVAGERLSVGLDAVARKVAADALDVAQKQREDVRVVTRIDGLREVDQRHSAIPVEDVVLRQVAVDAMTGQKALNVVHHILEEKLRLFPLQRNLAQQWRRIVHITDILHQYRVTDLEQRSGHARTS